jgi:AraC-like DNA-binding protein
LPLTAAGRYILQILDSVAYSAYYRNNKAISLIYALLYELIDQLEHASIDHGKAELTFQTVEEYICQNYHLPIGREDISTALGLNPSYLSRLFQRFAKTTIHKHLIRLRMGKAIFLLLESNLTIKEIALRCGFEDSNYFIRVFKAWHGITPSKLRTTSKLRN